MDKRAKLIELVKTTIRECLNESKIIKESTNSISKLLKKAQVGDGLDLTYDEKVFLDKYKNGISTPKLEQWLFSDDEETFDLNGNKLLFDKFEQNEDILYNHDKLIRVITKHLNKKPFTNNADWGSGYVWNLTSNDNFIGTFLYLGDDELLILKRTLRNGEYYDKVIKNITNSSELYKILM